MLNDITESDALNHASSLFGLDFLNFEELKMFALTLDSPQKLIKNLKQPERLLFDTSWIGTLEEQINKALNSEWRQLNGGHHPGIMVAGMCYSRMAQATDILLKSRYLSGVPLIEAPTSWKYFNWKLEYNAGKMLDDLTS